MTGVPWGTPWLPPGYPLNFGLLDVGYSRHLEFAHTARRHEMASGQSPFYSRHERLRPATIIFQVLGLLLV